MRHVLFFSSAGVLCSFSQRGDGGRLGGGHYAYLPAVCVLYHQGKKTTTHMTGAFSEFKPTDHITNGGLFLR